MESTHDLLSPQLPDESQLGASSVDACWKDDYQNINQAEEGDKTKEMDQGTTRCNEGKGGVSDGTKAPLEDPSVANVTAIVPSIVENNAKEIDQATTRCDEGKGGGSDGAEVPPQDPSVTNVIEDDGKVEAGSNLPSSGKRKRTTSLDRLMGDTVGGYVKNHRRPVRKPDIFVSETSRSKNDKKQDKANTTTPIKSGSSSATPGITPTNEISSGATPAEQALGLGNNSKAKSTPTEKAGSVATPITKKKVQQRTTKNANSPATPSTTPCSTAHAAKARGSTTLNATPEDKTTGNSVEKSLDSRGKVTAKRPGKTKQRPRKESSEESSEESNKESGSGEKETTDDGNFEQTSGETSSSSTDLDQEISEKGDDDTLHVNKKVKKVENEIINIEEEGEEVPFDADEFSKKDSVEQKMILASNICVSNFHFLPLTFLIHSTDRYLVCKFYNRYL